MTENYSFQASFKTKYGTLINLRAETEQELSEQLEALGRLISTIDETEALVKAMETVNDAFSRSAPAAGGGAAPASAPAAAPGGGRTCGHGEMVYKTGAGKNGRNWEAYMCPAPKGDPTQCKPQWL